MRMVLWISGIVLAFTIHASAQTSGQADAELIARQRALIAAAPGMMQATQKCVDALPRSTRFSLEEVDPRVGSTDSFLLIRIVVDHGQYSKMAILEVARPFSPDSEEAQQLCALLKEDTSIAALAGE